MNEKMFDALEAGINALQTGADAGSVAKRFPGLEGDLLPLLETSRQARGLAVPSVPEHVYRSSKMRVLKHASEMRASARKQRKSVLVFPRLAVSLAVALLFLLSGTRLVRASGGALPGDNLYPLKRTWEDVRLRLVFSPESRKMLEGEFEQERVKEVDELLAEGRHELIYFAGVVTEQNGDLWVVSGVRVQIMPDSLLPSIPVTMGSPVILEGFTNANGFVEVKRIELLELGTILPAAAPTEVDDLGDQPRYENSGRESENHSNRFNEESDDLSHEDGGSEDSDSDDASAMGNDDRSKDYSRDGNDNDNESKNRDSGGSSENNNDSDNESHD